MTRNEGQSVSLTGLVHACPLVGLQHEGANCNFTGSVARGGILSVRRPLEVPESFVRDRNRKRDVADSEYTVTCAALDFVPIAVQAHCSTFVSTRQRRPLRVSERYTQGREYSSCVGYQVRS